RRQTQPEPFGVGTRLVGELALEHEELHALVIRRRSRVGAGTPAFESCDVRETGLLVEGPQVNSRDGACHPGKLCGLQNHMLPVAAGELPQLHEQHATRVREWGMTEALRVEKIGAGWPIAMLVG